VLAKYMFTGTRTKSLRPGCTRTSARTTRSACVSKVYPVCSNLRLPLHCGHVASGSN
jgi:hypothetical protein